MLVWILALGFAYLIGSIPFGYILVRSFKQEDIRETGSGNIGATNVLRSGSKVLGIVTLLLDVLKGVLAVVVAQHLAWHYQFPDGYRVAAAAGVVVVFAHIFPVWLSFRGGKGVATALGVFFALTPLSALIALGVFIVIAFLTGYVSLASVVAAVTLCVLAILTSNKHSLFVDLCYILITLMVVTKHSGNIQRLLNGTENRFGKRGRAQASNTEAQ